MAQQVNERHEPNWNKIDRFVKAVRTMPPIEEVDDECIDDERSDPSFMTTGPRAFDVIGDVAVVYALPEDTKDWSTIGQSILSKNKAIQLVVARQSTFQGDDRAPTEQLIRLAARTNSARRRSPLMTTHKEYSISCVVDLDRTFFSPRMGQERLRLSQLVGRGEHVLVVFAGVGMEAFFL